MKILVTGTTGLIGYNLSKRLYEGGDEVFGIIHTKDKRIPGMRDRYSEGDLVIIMDDDFQNPPEEAFKLAEYSLKNDHDVIFRCFSVF